MLDFVKSMRENSWVGLEIFTVAISFLLGILDLILIFVWDLFAITLFYFLMR